MSDHARFLHNMSAPPRSVITYSGLSRRKTNSAFGRPAIGNLKCSTEIVFGNFVAFRLPKGMMRVRSAASMLQRLGKEAGLDAEETLLDLIERRVTELPLPDGCVVKPCERNHTSPWPDPLAAPAIITKSSTNVWLRGKAPRLSLLGKRSSVSLLLPPAFAARLQEIST